MPLALPSGVNYEITLAPHCNLPTTEPWQVDVYDLIQAGCQHPNIFPEAKLQHLSLINRCIKRDFPGRSSSDNSPHMNRQQRRAQQRKSKRGDR